MTGQPDPTIDYPVIMTVDVADQGEDGFLVREVGQDIIDAINASLAQLVGGRPATLRLAEGAWRGVPFETRMSIERNVDHVRNADLAHLDHLRDLLWASIEQVATRAYQAGVGAAGSGDIADCARELARVTRDHLDECLGKTIQDVPFRDELMHLHALRDWLGHTEALVGEQSLGQRTLRGDLYQMQQDLQAGDLHGSGDQLARLYEILEHHGIGKVS